MSYPIEPLDIRSPTELRELLAKLERAVIEGRLIEYRPTGATVTANLSSIFAERAHWPDYIEAYLRDPTSGDTFRLAVETYHGSGGSPPLRVTAGLRTLPYMNNRPQANGER